MLSKLYLDYRIKFKNSYLTQVEDGQADLA